MRNKGLKYWWKFNVIWNLRYYWDLLLVFLKLKKPYTEEDFEDDMLEMYRQTYDINFEDMEEVQEFKKSRGEYISGNEYWIEGEE